MIHALKQDKTYFDDVVTGRKLFEVRFDDRNYMRGDLIALNEWDPEKKEYTGRSCLVYIDYILNDEMYVKEGYVIMTIKPCAVYYRRSAYNVVEEKRKYGVPIIDRVTLETEGD